MLITSPPVSVGIGQTVQLVIQAVAPDGKTVLAGAGLIGLTWASSDTDVANLATQANADGSIAVTISQVGTATLSSQAQVTDANGVVDPSAQGTVTLTVTEAPADPVNPPTPAGAGLLMTFTVS